MPSVTHLADRRGNLFDDIAIPYTAAEATEAPQYLSQSRALAAAARAARDITGADVLDVACGFGITTHVLAGYNPQSIAAFDASRVMVELAHLVTKSDEPVKDWLVARGGEALLGDSLVEVGRYIAALRAGFRQFHFAQAKRPLELAHSGLMEFSPGRQYDIVVSNNALHWPVSQLRQSLPHPDDSVAVQTAVSTVLAKVRSLVRPGGVFAFLTHKVFVRLADSTLDSFLMARWMGTHPVLAMLNESVRSLLAKEFGHAEGERGAPPILFDEATIGSIAEASGFHLLRTTHVQETLVPRTSALEYFRKLIPINLGDVNLAMPEKIEVVNRATALVRARANQLPMNQFIPDQHHIFVLQAT